MKRIVMVILAIAMATGVYGEAKGQTPPPVPAEEQPEAMTRGPVNEAFAQPVTLDDQTGLTAPTAPPADIVEVPPSERPAGGQFAWIPGYWAWDSDHNSYIWVSGCWRAVPPGMSWVPGYWTQTDGGWQWVAGFWAPEDDSEIEYLPPPPEVVAVAPPGPAPSPDQLWVPPCWYWHHGRYIQRRGYWIQARTDWIWVPSHYIWTPRGYVFAKGHWDYPMSRRGVLFAPLLFPGRPPLHRRFSYSLSIVVDLGNPAFGLFVRPAYCHYYFGDYYDSTYIRIGIFPWFEFQQRRTWYDPIYVHDRWRYRKSIPHWDRHERQVYNRRRADKALRPPHTYREMARWVRRLPASERRHMEIARPMSRVVTSRTTAFKFERAKPDARRQIYRHTEEVRKFSSERRHWEGRGSGRGHISPGRSRMPSASPREVAPMENRREPQAHPSARNRPEAEGHPRDARGRGRRQDSSRARPEERRPDEAAPGWRQEQRSDRVRVRRPPAEDRGGWGRSREKGPSRPNQEQRYVR